MESRFGSSLLCSPPRPAGTEQLAMTYPFATSAFATLAPMRIAKKPKTTGWNGLPVPAAGQDPPPTTRPGSGRTTGIASRLQLSTGGRSANGKTANLGKVIQAAPVQSPHALPPTAESIAAA